MSMIKRIHPRVCQGSNAVLSVASMSEPVKHVEGRLYYRCGTCVIQDAGEPGSASSPLHVLYLYALVEVGEQALTPLHSKPVRLVVLAPQDERPSLEPFPRIAWRHVGASTGFVWCHAGPYRGEPSE